MGKLQKTGYVLSLICIEYFHQFTSNTKLGLTSFLYIDVATNMLKRSGTVPQNCI